MAESVDTGSHTEEKPSPGDSKTSMDRETEATVDADDEEWLTEEKRSQEDSRTSMDQVKVAMEGDVPF
jgi:hypothetical protein